MRLKNEAKQLINVLTVYLGSRQLRLSLHGLAKQLSLNLFVTESSEIVVFISYALLSDFGNDVTS